MSIRTLAKDWLPPAVLRGLRSLRSDGIRFEGDYATWEEAAAHCTGYDAAPILAKVLDATLKVKRGEGAYERDSVLFDEIDYAWPVTTALMWAAAQSGGRLDVLDFGGALGSSYYQNRAFLTGLPQVRWSVVEQAHYVEAGRKHIQDDTLRFYSSIDQCLAESKPNAILLSSVLQYLPEIDVTIKEINHLNASVIIVDRTPFTDAARDKICIQYVPESIYAASYPMRVFSHANFFEKLQNWQVIGSSHSLDKWRFNSSLQIRFEDFILRRKSC